MSRHRYDPDDPEVQLRRRHDEPGWDALSLFAVDASERAEPTPPYPAAVAGGLGISERQLREDLAAAPYPTAPAAGDEQRPLALEGSIEGRYHAWRRTEEGGLAFCWIAARAASMVAQGATRLSIAQLVEGYRLNERRSVNNTYRAPMVRELEDRYPILRGLFEARVRRSA